MAELGLDPADRRIGRGQPRREPDGGGVVLERPFAHLQPDEDLGAIEVGDRVARLELDRLAEVRDRLVVLADREVGQPAIGVRPGVLRIEPDRLVQVLDRPLVLAQGVVDRAAVLIGRSLLRVEPDRLVQVADRAVVAARAGTRTPPRSLWAAAFSGISRTTAS